MSYILKLVPEDFFVEEFASHAFSVSGTYAIYSLTKSMLTTPEAIDRAASLLHADSRKIGYGGLKDKHAVTTQYISVPARKGMPDSLKTEGITLLLKGFLDEPIHIGLLTGNRFRIVIRNISRSPPHLDSMVNYFGEQRFSSANAEIGRALVKKEYLAALDLISKGAIVPDYSEEKNLLGVLQSLNQKMLMLYMHAYQSLLWNMCVATYVKKKGRVDGTFPLIGFGLECTDPVKMKIIEDVLAAEGVTLRDFIMRQLPGLGVEGSERSMNVHASELSLSALFDDELNPGMKKCTLSFALPKGSYGTEFVKQMMDGQ